MQKNNYQKIILYGLYFLIFIRHFKKVDISELKKIYDRFLENKHRIKSMTTYERAYYCSGLREVIRSYIYDFIIKSETSIRDCFGNVKFAIYPKNEMTRILYVSRTYEEETMNFLQKELKHSDIFLDIGANNGTYSMFCSRLCKQAFAFEPSKRDFARLKKNKELNNFTNLTIENVGLSNQKNKATILIADDYHSGQNTMETKFVYSSVALKEKQEINLIKLDDYVKEKEIKKIDVIKIDVDGHEMMVLEGAKDIIDEKKPRAIIFEIVTEWPEKKIELELFFKNNGYEIFAIEQNGDLTLDQKYSSGNLVAYKKND